MTYYKQGIVKWFDKRDGNGIIKSDDVEYYTDISAIQDRLALRSGQLVEFIINSNIKEIRCAMNVKILERK